MVVICFQNCIFEISKTVEKRKKIAKVMLWFAFKIVSLKYRKQLVETLAALEPVVICFQNCIFEISKTVPTKKGYYKSLLWFAFKIVSLKYRKQSTLYTRQGCPVVICFQNCIFEISKTVERIKIGLTHMLWFAFKIVSLKYRKQYHQRKRH